MSKRLRRSQDEFVECMKNISPTIEVLGKYINTVTPMLVKCKIDGFEWNVLPKSLLSGKGCKECQRRLLSKIHTISHDDFCRIAESKNNKLVIVGEYIGSGTKIKVLCNKHNLEYMTYPSVLLKGCGCKMCRSEITSEKNKKTNEEFIKQLYDKYKEDVFLLDTYIDDKTKIRFKHKCGCIFYSSPTNILQKLSCPDCHINSKGEQKIGEYLKASNEKYQPQKTYDGLLGIKGKKLSYDFYLPDYNLLIEYQGEQHEYPVDFNGKGIKKAQEKFKKQQEYDSRKREYAQLHNIRLLEIWYWDFKNIETILHKELDKTDSYFIA